MIYLGELTGVSYLKEWFLFVSVIHGHDYEAQYCGFLCLPLEHPDGSPVVHRALLNLTQLSTKGQRLKVEGKPKVYF